MLLAVARASHPGPAITVTVVVVLLGAAVGLDAARVAVLGVAAALDQLSVGLSNDWIDADRDRAAGRRDKPVALGLVSPFVVRNTAVAAATAAVLATLPLGWAATTAHVAALASAWSYNVRLKSTPLSVLPYVVSFGLLPAIVTLALPHPSPPTWWVVAAGALLGVSAHLANVLPDLDDDRRTGVSGLAHRMPPRLALVVTWAALVGASVALAYGIGLTQPFAVVALATTVATAVAGVVLGLRGADRWGFRLVMLAAVADVLLLVAAGTRMVA